MVVSESHEDEGSFFPPFSAPGRLIGASNQNQVKAKIIASKVGWKKTLKMSGGLPRPDMYVPGDDNACNLSYLTPERFSHPRGPDLTAFSSNALLAKPILSTFQVLPRLYNLSGGLSLASLCCNWPRLAFALTSSTALTPSISRPWDTL